MELNKNELIWVDITLCWEGPNRDFEFYNKNKMAIIEINWFD